MTSSQKQICGFGWVGPARSTIDQTIVGLSFDRMDALGEALFDFKTKADLCAWLEQMGE